MPTPSTADFEYLLEKTNVIGVDYSRDDDTVRVWVSQKLAAEALPSSENVARRENLPDWFEGDVDVLDAGYGDERDGFDPATPTPERVPDDDDAGHPHPSHASPEAAGRQQRIRPIQAGVSEIHAHSTAATGGVLAVVRDPDAATWGDDIHAGTLVRISNHHVYGHPINECPVDGSARVLQPSPYDGGESNDLAGTVAGYAPLEDGTAVDAAARRVTTQDAPGVYDFSLASGEVYGAGYDTLRGQMAVKTGRSSGVTEGRIQATDATTRVGYGGDVGAVTCRHQIIAADMSVGGDSGSPVFLTTGGAFVGHVFAGSDSVTVVNRADYIETALGVSLMPDETESLDETVDVQMAAPELTDAAVDVDATPSGGETVTVMVSAGTNYETGVWFEAHGPADSSRQEVPADGLTEQDDGTWQASADLSVTAPTAYSESFAVVVTGGHVLDG